MANVFSVEITYINRVLGEVKEHYSCDTFPTAIALVNRYLKKEEKIYGKPIYDKEFTELTELPLIINLPDESNSVLDIRIFEDEIMTIDTISNFIDED